ncbi:MAG: glycosyltransferase family 8 protein [Lachnospiraceae bacterium]|nr:glycosyltransferase family 8 protein [Lachnospiraceae bacterium]
MSDNMIHILVSFDKKYIPPFKVMLHSLLVNNPQERFHVWLLQNSIPSADLRSLEEYCNVQSAAFTAVQIDGTLFQNAPVSRQYPQEMYYRLLAAQLLPDTLDRVLYLDPDILVINPLRPLWKTELSGAAFAAASHSWEPDTVNDINRIRLETGHDYYNTGVLLMDLSRMRGLIVPDEIYNYIREHREELLLPDQDVFNALYGKDTVQVDDRLWNYDVRHSQVYRLKSEGICNTDWVMRNTAILHFCGKYKPWRAGYTNRFGVLYKHYMNLTERLV